MKLKQVSLLCAVACAALAGQAHAQVSNVPAAQTIVNDANAQGRVFFVSGASAVDGGMGQIAQTLFDGTVYHFAVASGTGFSLSDHRAYAGRLRAGVGGAWAGQNVIIIKRSAGGSVQGVNPLARSQAIAALNVTTAACAGGSGTSAAPFTCTVNASLVPDAGISDVAPALFHGTYNTEGETPAAALTPTELASLRAEPVYSLAFGLPVSKTVPVTTKFTKPIVAGIMTGSVGDWSQVDANLGGDILLCRRTNGSGTQAISNLYYGNYPCDTGSANNAPADRTVSEAWNPTTGNYTIEGNSGWLTVVEHSSSGHVRACLNAATTASAATFQSDPNHPQAYTTYTTGDRNGVTRTVRLRNGVEHKAIGVLSMDSLGNSTVGAANGWTFRALDGAGEITWDDQSNAPVTSGTGRLPTVDNLLDGTWDQQGWISFNTRTASSGAKAALANNFVAAAKSPDLLVSLNSLRYVAAAIPSLSVPSTGQTLRVSYLNNNQCAPLNSGF